MPQSVELQRVGHDLASMQGFPYLPGEPQDEAGLLRKFEM